MYNSFVKYIDRKIQYITTYIYILMSTIQTTNSQRHKMAF